jgi:hypothetical protein
MADITGEAAHRAAQAILIKDDLSPDRHEGQPGPSAVVISGSHCPSTQSLAATAPFSGFLLVWSNVGP